MERRNLGMFLAKTSLVVIFIQFVGAHPHTTDVLRELDHETHLYFHLLDDQHYVPHLRPASSHNVSVIVTIDLTLTSVQGLDEINQQLKSSMLLLMSWFDPRLQWNISDFGGLQSITLPSHRVWRPDVKLLHSQYGSFEHFDAESVRVFSNGAVTWSAHAHIRSYCPLSLQQFPFDVQNCRIELSTNVYNAKQIHLRFPDSGLDVSVSQTMLTTNMDPAWTLLSRRVEGRLGGGEVRTDGLELVRVWVQLQRRAGLYQCVLLGPAVVLALLVPVIFLLPSHSPTKTTLGMLILVALCVCLKNVCDMMGSHRASVPRIAAFYVVTMALAGISVIMAALVSATARTSQAKRAIPAWLNTVFLGRCGLRRLLCLEPYSASGGPENFSPIKVTSDLHDNDADMASLKDDQSDLRDVSRSLRTLIGRYSAEQAQKMADSEWREIARVVDRLLFICFVVLFMLTSISILS